MVFTLFSYLVRKNYLIYNNDIMKKQLLLTLLAPMMLASVSGCSTNSGMKLTYGTYITSEDANVTDATELTFGSLSKKMDVTSDFSKENFLLVVAPTNGCYCWIKFQKVLKEFIKQTNYLVYQIKYTELESDNLGFKIEQGNVSFAIVKGGKIVKQYISSSIFENVDSLKAEVNKYVKAPDLYYVDRDFLNNAIKTQEPVLVEYIREACGDCQYASPNAVWEFAHKNTFKTKMYVIALDEIRKDPVDYKEFKDTHNLSNVFSPDFGYGDGVVPTFQYYERGELKSASVYFNDTVEMVNGQLTVTTSYYSATRRVKLDYASSVKTNILEGLILTADDVDDYTAQGYGYIWKHESANKYHKPLFEAFMNKYAL